MAVLITGANGLVARHVIHALLATSVCPPIRALAHSESSKQELRSIFPQLLASPHEIVVADYLFPQTLLPVFEGVSIIFHNGPCFHPLESEMGMAVIDAAMDSANSPYFIFCSCLHPFRTKLPNHKAKMIIEQHLLESSLDYTILQPTHFMQSVPTDSVRQTAVLALGHSLTVPHGFIDLVDLAMVVKSVIISPAQHNLASYELVGQNITYYEILEKMRAVLGKPVAFKALSSKVFAAQLIASGSHKYSQDEVEQLILYHDTWGLTGNENTLRWLLGREPTTWDEYLNRALRLPN